MTNRHMIPFLMAGLAVVFAAGTTRAQRVYLVVDRVTGELTTVSSADVEVDGYTITSSSGTFNTDAWNSLEDQGAEGWAEANPRNEQLTELNWEGSAALQAGVPLSMGTPYNSEGIFPSQEDIEKQYSTPDGELGTASVHYVGASQVPAITVDRQTGQIDVSNPLGFEITGYTISSPGGALLPDNFNGLADQGEEGWNEANPSSGRLSELNLTSSRVVDGSSPFSIGNVFTPGAGEDLTFEYLTLEGELGDGLVSYLGPPNDLTLEVELLSGAASITNSSLASDFDIIGYSIFSDGGSLSVDNWTSFASTGAGGEGWTEANPTSNALAELNPTGSTLFSSGTSIDLGNILVGNQEDLVFQYATVDGPALGTVNYVLNLDGGQPPVGIAGDIDGDGTVGFPDFLILSGNFGMAGGAAQGDIDGDGTIGFPDFLILSGNFGQSAGAAAAVPEPATGMLAMLAALGLLAAGRRR